LADELVVEPEAVFVSGRFEPGARRAAEEAHARRGLKNVGRKRAAVDVEFDAKIARIREPGDLISWIEDDHLRYKSNQYGTLCHFSSAPCFGARRGDFSGRGTIAHPRGRFAAGVRWKERFFFGAPVKTDLLVGHAERYFAPDSRSG
jgi:hypothetical protein